MSKLAEFRSFVHKINVDAFILHTQDEYLRAHSEDLKQLCGFTGTNGVLIVVKSGKCPFFTDGRYITQAHSQLDHTNFEIYNIKEKDPCEWMRENVPSTITLSYHSQYFTVADLRKYEQVCKLVPYICEERSDDLKQRVILHPSGEGSQSKCERIARAISGAEAVLLTDVNSISWLLNIRNENMEYTPHVLCRAILYKDGSVDLFIQGGELEIELNNQVRVFNINELANQLQKLSSIIIDPNTVSMGIANLIMAEQVVEKEDPCLLSKAIKNRTEVMGAIDAHIRDGVAVTKFLRWLENNVNNGVTELDAEEKILEYRKEQSLFKQLSFPTISAFNENAAIVHYRADNNTNKIIKKNGLYLIDSGGQYLDGTTDVTRTVAIGIPTREQITHYTIVLKAHIAIASAVFPLGTTGGDLDILARMHLWKFGMDYPHGTGHGVGSYLSVHEGPQAISKGNKIKLVSGMIVSNEPGYYVSGKYGIRIENLMYVDEQENGYLRFKQLTCVPYDKRLIDTQMLTQDEVRWLSKYEEFVCKSLKVVL
ncbi:MAG: aminopeptidase P family protein [Wolbachia endosymbiont of Tyrophagus putrescentiae]|nr:aminopeptidase P family protein [Wolbachia endosymbiont of Tyrophagus putrescentiae]